MKIYDESGNLLENPDMSAGYLFPLETIQHDFTPAVTHEETREFPGGRLTYTVIDSPAKEAWEEIISYVYHPNPPTELDQLKERVENMQAENTAALDDVYSALTELAEIIIGGVI